MLRRSAVLVLSLVALFVSRPLHAEPPKTSKDVPVIPRSVLFGNPDRASPQISPDGKHLAFLADVEGVMNVWIAPVDKPDTAKPVTEDKKRGIRQYFWAFNSDTILYIQDKDGDENWHVYAANIKTVKTTDLTPLEGIQARIQKVSHKFPNEVLLAINDRDKQLHDVYRVNLQTGDRKLIEQNPGFVGYMADHNFDIRLAMKMTPDGGMEVQK